MHHGNLLGHIHAVDRSVVGLPRGCRDLENPGVVHGAMVGIKIWVFPYRPELRISNCVQEARIFKVDRVAYGLQSRGHPGQWCDHPIRRRHISARDVYLSDLPSPL